MSEHEIEFLRQMYAILAKVKRFHRTTVWVVGISATLIVTFGCVILVQGFETTKNSVQAIEKMESLTQTQDVMFQVFNNQFGDLKATDKTNKDDLQRQLDFLMKDRKLVERGLTIDESGKIIDPKWQQH